MQGKVRQLPTENEPGIIRGPGKRDFWFNWNDVKGNPDALTVDQEVTFDQGFEGKPWAKKVIPPIVEAKPPAPPPLEEPVEPPIPDTIDQPTNEFAAPSVEERVKSPADESAEAVTSGATDPSIDEPAAGKSAPQSPKPSFPPPSHAHPFPRNGFVNPYNFVPLSAKPPQRSKAESHEYFVGNSGRIMCTLTLQTPFFTPHPERRWRVPTDNADVPSELTWLDPQARNRIQNAKADHEVLGLLTAHDKKPFIPGSLLKGAFRSVAEALSNSCLGIIDFQWKRLGKNPSDEVKIKEAANYFSQRVIRSPRGVGRIAKLPSQDGEGVIEVGKSLKVFFDSPSGFVGGTPLTHNLTVRKDYDEMKAASRIYNQAGFGNRTFPIEVAQTLGSGGLSGRFKITDVIEKKKSQRFIYWPTRRTVNFTQAQELAYNRANEVAINEEGSMTGYIACAPPNAGMRAPRHQLRKDDLVYFDEQGGQVKSIGPVELYRILYTHSLDAVLLRKHQEFLTCHKPDDLCPCCRSFGWVPPTGDEETATTSRKGFVHFSTATLDQKPEDIQTQWVTLKPLGQPHPSCWQFYLDATDSGPNAGYNDDHATINGRKFYWHQPGTKASSVKDERKTEKRQPQPPDNQNKTVELLLEKTKQGKVVSFTFTVDFENLSKAELGLLLLTLQPNLLGEGNIPSLQLSHHMGMGKPLGLGSAAVVIDTLMLIDRATRYQNLTADGKTAYTQDQMNAKPIQDFIDAFVKNALGEDKADRCTFATQPHIEPLLIMLDFANAPKPVQYPPGAKSADEKAYWESFNWFTSPNQRGINQQKHTLYPPREIVGSERQAPKRQDAFEPRDLSRSNQGNQAAPRQGGRHHPRGGRRT